MVRTSLLPRNVSRATYHSPLRPHLSLFTWMSAKPHPSLAKATPTVHVLMSAKLYTHQLRMQHTQAQTDTHTRKQIHTHAHTHTHTHASTYIRTHMQADTHVRTHTHTHASMHTHTHTRKHICTHTHTEPNVE